MAEVTKLGRYQIRRVLGRGAMGVVYEGHDPALNRRVAIKTILKNAAIDEETSRAYSALFMREAQAAGRLNHPNIVQIHDFAEQGEVAYLVMEFIQGRELRSFFEAKERFEPAETVRIMGELLDALDLAHDAGVIHRDIKPANVMLDAQRRVKLADFGVARIQDSDKSAAGTMVGTPAFMSPEQIQGGKIDRRTDLFSAGTILYQMLTGEQPFTGEGAWTVAKKIVQDDPARPSTIVKSISPIYDDIVHKALAKTPAERYASAREFADALRATLGGATASIPPIARTVPPIEVPKAKAKPEVKASEAEVEFWRSIQNSTDADELEFYLEQFPEGTYAPLARHKIAKLREPLEAARKEAEEKARQEAEAAAQREAEEKARREAEEAAQRAAQEKAHLENEAKARAEAEAKARREAEAKAKREAIEKAQREAQEKARREAEEKAKREAAEKQRQAAALAKLKAEEEARAKAKVAAAVVDEDATVAVRSSQPVSAGKSYLIPSVLAVVVAAAGIGAFFYMQRKPAPAPVVVAPPVVEKPAAPAVDIEKIKRETEERIRKEYADKSVAEKAAATKAAVEKEVAEKQAAAKAAAAEKTAAAKAAQEKAAAEKLAAEKASAEKATAEKAALAKAEAEKAAAAKAAEEKAAAEKLAAEKAAAEKAAAAKAAAAKPGWPAVGDKWVYEVRQAGKTFQTSAVVDMLTEHTIFDTGTMGSNTRQRGHSFSLQLVGVAPGIAGFNPYLQAFQQMRAGEKLNVMATIWGCGGQNTCDVPSAQIVGRESVTVKAGTFNAWKVVIELNSTYVTDTRRRQLEFTFWYAPEAKRTVKYRYRLVNGFPWSHPDTEIELVSYTPAK